MTAPTLTLETAEERELWRHEYSTTLDVLGRVGSASERDAYQRTARQWADDAVRAYRERCAPGASEPTTVDVEALRQVVREIQAWADDVEGSNEFLAAALREDARRILDAIGRPPAEGPECGPTTVDWHHEWSRECERFNALARAILSEGWDDYLTPGEVLDLCMWRLRSEPYANGRAPFARERHLAAILERIAEGVPDPVGLARRALEIEGRLADDHGLRGALEFDLGLVEAVARGEYGIDELALAAKRLRSALGTPVDIQEEWDSGRLFEGVSGEQVSEAMNRLVGDKPAAGGAPTGPGWTEAPLDAKDLERWGRYWWGRLSSTDAFEPWEVTLVGGELCFDWPEWPGPSWLPESRLAHVERAMWGGPCLQGSAARCADGSEILEGWYYWTGTEWTWTAPEGCLQGSADADAVDDARHAMMTARAERDDALARLGALTRAVEAALQSLEDGEVFSVTDDRLARIDARMGLREALDTAKGDA